LEVFKVNASLTIGRNVFTHRFPLATVWNSSGMIVRTSLESDSRIARAYDVGTFVG
jgi:hypothetical protein